jgi:Bacteriophage T4-like portal protein (Gp20)
MAGWKKYFTPVNTSGKLSPVSGSMMSGLGNNPSRTNYSSYLPDVYAGHPNRLERYGQYDTMDSDSEVNAAFDILAEFCTQLNEENGTPFTIKFKEQANGTEIKIIKKYLQQWCKANKFPVRIFKIVRNAFKYGDSFFVRDPETQKWLYVDPAKVDKIIVNESEGKKPEQYMIRDFNPNFEALATTAIQPSNQQGGGSQFGGSYGSGQGGAGGSRGMVGSFPTSTNSSRFGQNQNQYAIDARHVIHISMSEGLDNNFPFGNSLMEGIFKVFKQKELLEDAILIYRIQRAPERRVFYIDVGNMPSHLAMSFVERVKNEVNQRRIPSVTGGGQSVVDAGYNPLSINEDYFFRK